MVNYNVEEFQKFFNEHGADELEVTAVSEYGYITRITVKRKETRLNEYVKNRFLKNLIFKSGGEIYKLLMFYVNVGGKKGGIKTVFVLKNGDKIIDVISLHEFENAENFDNPNLTLTIDKIIAEEVC